MFQVMSVSGTGEEATEDVLGDARGYAVNGVLAGGVAAALKERAPP
jgi:hypothetical protein